MSSGQAQNGFDPIKATLSIHGDLFQQRCVRAIAEQGWQLLAEEYPVSSGLFYGSLDIWASLLGSGEGPNLLIECKKAHPTYKKWIFLSKSLSKEVSFPAVKMRKNSLSSSDPKIDPYKQSELAGLAKAEPNIQTGFVNLDRATLRIQAYAYNAHEIRLDDDNRAIIRSYEKSNRTRERPPHERIYHGCQQLSLATRSILYEELKLMEKQTYITIPPAKFFIPVLVTTAELVSCYVNPKDIDLTTGEMMDESALEFKQVDRVAYYFPMPEEMYLYPRDVRGDIHIPFLKSASEMEEFKELYVIVVHSSNFNKFLEDLKFYAKGLV